MKGADIQHCGGTTGGSPRVSAVRSNGMMFWTLMALAGAGFVPCALVPVWNDYRQVDCRTRQEEERTESLRAAVESQRRTLAAIRTDPAVAGRMAQRELAYVRPGEFSVDVPGVTTAGHGAIRPIVPPPEQSGSIPKVMAHFASDRFDRVFARGPARTVLMCLAGMVVVTAMVLFPPGASAPRPQRRSTN